MTKDSDKLSSGENNTYKQNEYPRPLQDASPIYMYSRKSNQFTPYQGLGNDGIGDVAFTSRIKYKENADPPLNIKVDDENDYSSVSDSCVTGTKSIEMSESGSTYDPKINIGRATFSRNIIEENQSKIPKNIERRSPPGTSSYESSPSVSNEDHIFEEKMASKATIANIHENNHTLTESESRTTIQKSLDTQKLLDENTIPCNHMESPLRESINKASDELSFPSPQIPQKIYGASNVQKKEDCFVSESTEDVVECLSVVSLNNDNYEQIQEEIASLCDSDKPFDEVADIFKVQSSTSQSARLNSLDNHAEKLAPTITPPNPYNNESTKVETIQNGKPLSIQDPKELDEEISFRRKMEVDNNFSEDDETQVNDRYRTLEEDDENVERERLDYNTVEETIRNRSELIASLKSRLTAYLDTPDDCGEESYLDYSEDLGQVSQESSFDQFRRGDDMNLSLSSLGTRMPYSPYYTSNSPSNVLASSKEKGQSLNVNADSQISIHDFSTNNTTTATYQSFAALSMSKASPNVSIDSIDAMRRESTRTEISNVDKLRHEEYSNFRTLQVETHAFKQDDYTNKQKQEVTMSERELKNNLMIKQLQEEIKREKNLLDASNTREPDYRGVKILERFGTTQQNFITNKISDEYSESSSRASEFWEIAEDAILDLTPNTSHEHLDKQNFNQSMSLNDGNLVKKEKEIVSNHKVIGKNVGVHKVLQKYSAVSNIKNDSEFEPEIPRRKFGQSLSSHLTSKTTITQPDTSILDEDSIFEFSQETESKTKMADENRIGSKTDTNITGSKDRVNFDDKRNTIHQFHEDDNFSGSYYSEIDEDDTTYTSYTSYTSDYSKDTFDTRASFNTLYSKSMQSEVEDAMKDLFFIGRGKHNAPGRRKVKYRSDIKEWKKERKRGKDDNESGTRINKEKDSKKSLENETDMSPIQLDWVWDYFETGINVVNEALGFTEPTKPTPSEIAKPAEEIIQKSSEQVASDTEYAVHSQPNESVKQSSKYRPTVTENNKSALHLDELGSLLDLNQTLPAKSSSSTFKLGQFSIVGIEELAMSAAQTHCKRQGLIYDAQKVDLTAEINICSFTISLPLGLLFQENKAGCWVTRVFRSGNAARNSNGENVEVGDQLACVNGQSMFQMKIDEACAMISSSSNQGFVELTFVRYVGTMRHKVKYDEKQYSSSYLSRNRSKKNGRRPVRDQGKSAHRKTPPPPPPRNYRPEDHYESNKPKIPYVDVEINEEHLKAPTLSTTYQLEGITQDKASKSESDIDLLDITKQTKIFEKGKDGGSKKKIRNLLGRFKKKKK